MFATNMRRRAAGKGPAAEEEGSDLSDGDLALVDLDVYADSLAEGGGRCEPSSAHGSAHGSAPAAPACGETSPVGSPACHGQDLSDASLAEVDLERCGSESQACGSGRAALPSDSHTPQALTDAYRVTPLTLAGLARDSPAAPASASGRYEEATPAGRSVAPPSEQHLATLHTFFGHTRFRPKQWDIIGAVLGGRDVCCIMATGYGKSLCFQFPALSTPGALAVVVCPLISLMEDQVMGLAEAGIAACVMGGAGPAMTRDVLDGRYRVVYMTPEWIQAHPSVLGTLHRRQHVAVVAVDEAHCVSQWGHDFRPAYRTLASLRQHLPGVPVMALTATATPAVRDDITRNLKLRDPLLCQTSFDRPNLYFEFGRRTSDVVADLLPLMIREGARSCTFEGATIIYCATRKRTEEVAAKLLDLQVKCAAYHAGLSDARRREVHHMFLRDELICVVATVAFGMGINKPDIRKVVHYGAPRDVESFYQEVGRAGRDGLPSVCHTLWRPSDLITNQSFLSDISSDKFLRHKQKTVSQIEALLVTTKCRRRLLLSFMGEGDAPTEEPTRETACSGGCDNCSTPAKDKAAPEDYSSEAELLMKGIQVRYTGRPPVLPSGSLLVSWEDGFVLVRGLGRRHGCRSGAPIPPTPNPNPQRHHQLAAFMRDFLLHCFPYGVAQCSSTTLTCVGRKPDRCLTAGMVSGYRSAFCAALSQKRCPLGR